MTEGAELSAEPRLFRLRFLPDSFKGVVQFGVLPLAIQEKVSNLNIHSQEAFVHYRNLCINEDSRNSRKSLKKTKIEIQKMDD